MRRILISLCCSFCFLFLITTTSYSQLESYVEFKVRLSGRPILKSYAGLDSVIHIYIDEFNRTIKKIYVGHLKNGLPEGLGTYMVNDNLVVYSGEWKNGVPNGLGNFFMYIYDGNLASFKFKGEFKNGVPIKGMLVFMKNKTGFPEIFYNGEVKCTQRGSLIIMPHGYGRMYVRSTIEPNHSAPGSYVEGQFIDGYPSGFAVYNKMAKENLLSLTTLQTGLLLHGLEVKVFNDLGIDASSFEKPYTIPSLNNSSLLKFLPHLPKAVYDTLYIDANASYYGMVYQQLPYGPGAVVYKDGYRDIGFWKNGEQVSSRNLLSFILPDSSVLQPVFKEEFHPVMKLVYNRKQKKDEWQMEREKRTVRYYASWENGVPTGYGWKEDTTTLSVAVAGFFRGEPSKNEWNADTNFVKVPNSYSPKIGNKVIYITPEYIDRKYFDGPYYAPNSAVSFSRYGEVLRLDSMRYWPIREYMLHPTVAMHDPRVFDASYKKYLAESAQQRMGLVNAIAAKPKANIFSVNYYPNDISRTEVITSAGVIKGEMLDRSQIKIGDIVLLGGGKFDNAPKDQQPPPDADVRGNSYYVIKNYHISETIFESTCSACNGSGGTTSNRSIDIASGYTVSPNYNLSGYSNGAMVYTPKYTSIGSYSVKNACPVCKGKPNKKTSTTKIVFKY